MLGILLAVIASGVLEVSESIGKSEMKSGHQKISETGFLNTVAALVYFVVLIFLRQSWSFSLASLSTFGPRILLEIILAEISIRVTMKAERSTYGMLRVITIPLLLIVDIFLGKNILPNQYAGIVVITLAMIFLYKNHGLNRRGAAWVLCSAVLAAVTISLYQYDITHFNSVESEQFITLAFMVLYFYIRTKLVRGRSIVQLYSNRKAVFQSLGAGVASVLPSFAYLFAPASVIATAVRSSAVLAALVSGQVFFREKHFMLKLVAGVAIMAGLILLAQ